MNANLELVDDKYDIKPKPVVWNGQRFPSKLEFLWNMYFIAKGVNFEHETERRVYDKEKNLYYTPDYTLINFINGENLYVEIKPKNEIRFIDQQKYKSFVSGESGKRKDSLLVITSYPWGKLQNYDYELYTATSFGVMLLTKDQIQIPKIDDLLDFHKNKDIFANVYCSHKDVGEEDETQKYLELCVKECTTERAGNEYLPNTYWTRNVYYILTQDRKYKKLTEYPKDVIKTAMERQKELERFIKYGLHSEQQKSEISEKEIIDYVKNFNDNRKNHKRDLDVTGLCKGGISEKNYAKLEKMMKVCGYKKVSPLVRALVSYVLDNCGEN